MTQPSFETAYSRLEEILGQLNSGKATLENALKLYEEANTLIVWCNTQLQQAEQKIETLMKSREGSLLLDEEGKPQKEPLSLKGPALSPL